MVAWDLMTDQRAVRVLALIQEELVVQRAIDGLLLFARMAGQKMGNGGRARILRRKIQRHAGLEERAQGLMKRVKVPADVFDGLPRAIQQHPDLQFGLLQFVVGHAEEVAAEKQFVVVANQPLVRACKTPRTRKFS